MARDEKWAVLIDFDGTITCRDADYEIADAVLGEGAEDSYGPIVSAFEELQIGTREYFERYLEMVAITPEQFGQHAVSVELRPGLHQLVEHCIESGHRLKIVSEGLDVYIEPILRACGLGYLDLSCNRALFEEYTYQVLAPEGAVECERCLNCKGEHIRRFQMSGFKTVIVGNGSSDLCAARAADLVFGRDTLLEHCQREGIPAIEWNALSDVAAGLGKL